VASPNPLEDAFLDPQAQKLLAAFIDRYRAATLGSLLRGIIHNLNGSLQVLSMQMELLQRMLPQGEDKVQGQMGKCLGQIDRFKGMLELLIRRRIHDEQQSPQSLLLNDILEEELSFLHHNLFFKHQVKVHKDLAPSLPLLKGSYMDFSQALSNVIQNSLEAMENSRRKELILRTRVQGKQVQVTIQDTGCGIPEEVKPRLFEPFFTTKGGNRAGLGLFVARRLLAPYGASFRYSSREEETVFEVSFPLQGLPSP
jgi:signal transduction histidine kinase